METVFYLLKIPSRLNLNCLLQNSTTITHTHADKVASRCIIRDFKVETSSVYIILEMFSVENKTCGWQNNDTYTALKYFWVMYKLKFDYFGVIEVGICSMAYEI